MVLVPVRGIVGQFYVEFAFEVFIGRSSSDDALPHQKCEFELLMRLGKRASSSDRLTREANLLDVPEVGAATAAENSDVAELAPQLGVLPAERDRIAGVEIGGLIEFSVAARRGIGAQPAQALDPGLAGFERIREVRRMRAVEHVVGRRFAGLGVDLGNRLLQRLPRR